MFCQACGAEISEQLRFCRNCGANLAPPAAPVKPASIPFRLIFLFLITALVGVVGLMGVLLTGNDMIRRDNPNELVMGLLILGALMTFTIIGMLGWLLSRLIRLTQQPERPAQSKAAVSERPPTPQIAPRPETIPSVIEHTTRSLEKVPPRG